MDEELKKQLIELLGEQAVETLTQAKDLQLINNAGGGYIPKADLDTKIAELQSANDAIKNLKDAAKQWDGKDPQKLADDLKDLQQKYDNDTADIRRNAAIDLALAKAQARDASITRAALNLDEIKVNEKGEVSGLDGQLEALKKDKAWLFEQGSEEHKPAYNPPAGGKPDAVNNMASAIAEHYKSQQ